jgi:hypothetical protein
LVREEGFAGKAGVWQLSGAVVVVVVVVGLDRDFGEIMRHSGW